MSLIYRDNHPGQGVMLIMGNDSQAAMKKFLVPGIRHFQKRYYWPDLEPVKDTYDFAEITSDVAWCASNGVLLTAMIQDKSFTNSTHVLPKGMAAYEIPSTGGKGLTSKRWDPAVVFQFNKLTAKLGAALATKAGFNGIATCETSLSIDNAVLAANKYTPEAYKSAYLSILANAAHNMPPDNVYWTMNFFAQNQAYLADIADAVRALGVQMGGPDCLPNSAPLLAGPYPLYEQFKGRMRLFIQVSPPGYSVPEPNGSAGQFMTPSEILAFAKEHLYVNTMFWYPIAPAQHGYSWADAVPVIAANPIINP